MFIVFLIRDLFHPSHRESYAEFWAIEDRVAREQWEHAHGLDLPSEEEIAAAREEIFRQHPQYREYFSASCRQVTGK